MAIKELVRGRVWEFYPKDEAMHMATIKDDAEREEYKQTKSACFKLRVMGAEKSAQMSDLGYSGGNIVRLGAVANFACFHSLVGWRNILDKDGKPSKFKGREDKSGTCEGATEEDLDKLAKNIRYEIYTEVTDVTEITEMDFMKSA